MTSSLNMSDQLSDSQNDYSSEDADITGSSSLSSSSSSSSKTTGEVAEQAGRTPDNLSSMYGIPSQSSFDAPTSKAIEGAARLQEILQVGPATRPYQEFIEELNRATQV